MFRAQTIAYKSLKTGSLIEKYNVELHSVLNERIILSLIQSLNRLR